MSQWELFRVDYRPIVIDGEAVGNELTHKLLSDHESPRAAFDAIQGYQAGFFTICPKGDQPDDWQAMFRTDDGTVYQAWGPVALSKRSAFEQVAS